MSAAAYSALSSDRAAAIWRGSKALKRMERQRAAVRIMAPNISFGTGCSPKAWGMLFRRQRTSTKRGSRMSVARIIRATEPRTASGLVRVQSTLEDAATSASYRAASLWQRRSALCEFGIQPFPGHLRPLAFRGAAWRGTPRGQDAMTQDGSRGSLWEPSALGVRLADLPAGRRVCKISAATERRSESRADSGNSPQMQHR